MSDTGDELTQRRGDWQQTFTGRKVWPLDPRPEEIFIEDIAHHLSNLCRFAGACREFYSVAQHCLYVSWVCHPADALWGLLHDAPETYVVDIPRPLKRFLEGYKDIENKIQQAVCHRFGLPPDEPESVCLADSILLHTEARDLMGRPPNSWKRNVEPWREKIIPMTPKAAEWSFLQRYRELTA